MCWRRSRTRLPRGAVCWEAAREIRSACARLPHRGAIRCRESSWPRTGEPSAAARRRGRPAPPSRPRRGSRSEEHTSELQSQSNLVCRLLLEKKKKTKSCIPDLSSCSHHFVSQFHDSPVGRVTSYVLQPDTPRPRYLLTDVGQTPLPIAIESCS